MDAQGCPGLWSMQGRGGQWGKTGRVTIAGGGAPATQIYVESAWAVTHNWLNIFLIGVLGITGGAPNGALSQKVP